MLLLNLDIMNGILKEETDLATDSPTPNLLTILDP